MVISKGRASDRSGMRRRHALGYLVLFALLSAVIAATPADARKRSKRSHYSPPASAMVLDAYSGKVLYADKPDQPYVYRGFKMINQEKLRQLDAEKVKID